MRVYGAVVCIRRAVMDRGDDEVVGLGDILVSGMLATQEPSGYKGKDYSASVVFHPYCILSSVYA